MKQVQKKQERTPAFHKTGRVGVMNKRIAVMLLVFVLLMSGCQKTPDTEPVVNKGDGRMEEAVYTTPVPDGDGFIVPRIEVPSR